MNKIKFAKLFLPILLLAITILLAQPLIDIAYTRITSYGAAKKLSSKQCSFKISPDQTKVAAIIFSNKNLGTGFDLFLFDIKSNVMQQLTRTGMVRNVSWINNDNIAYGEGITEAIRVINIKTKDIKNIYNFRSNISLGFNMYAQPSGNNLFVQAFEPLAKKEESFSIYLVNIDAQMARKIPLHEKMGNRTFDVDTNSNTIYYSQGKDVYQFDGKNTAVFYSFKSEPLFDRVLEVKACNGNDDLLAVHFRHNDQNDLIVLSKNKVYRKVIANTKGNATIHWHNACNNLFYRNKGNYYDYDIRNSINRFVSEALYEASPLKGENEIIYYSNGSFSEMEID